MEDANYGRTEFLLLLALTVHMTMAPGTKVEESFNVQAAHDFLFHRFNFSAYDHHTFPGVVPRTFAGPLAICSVILPFVKVFEWFDIPKYWGLFAVRFLLGAAVVWKFCGFAHSVDRHFGRDVGDFLRLTTVTQFHFLFYASRPLPNTFALIGVLWVYELLLDGKFVKALRVATAFTALFRCELVLLFGPVFAIPLLSRKLPLLGRHGAICNGIAALAVVLAISVPIDSFLWRRWLWPEGEVWWFNVILNKSHQYGVSSFFWYFTSALPRALMGSLLLLPAGLLVERRVVSIVLPVLVYVLLYSCLPHKELRFIIYTFPIFNLPAAALSARLWINRWKSWPRFLVAVGVCMHLAVNLLGTGFLIYASSRNYPGADAIGYLQHMQRYDRHKPVSVYIDNFAAQTGVSRFLQLYDAWEYNKTEGLEPSDLGRFDFLLIGSYVDRDIIGSTIRSFKDTHRLLFAVPAFQNVHFKKSSAFPYIWPVVRIGERLAVMKRLD